MYYLGEGSHVDSEGHIITCNYVDLREPRDRRAIATLVKASRKKFALPGAKSLRITKPAYFRDHGEIVLQDAQEGRAMREVLAEKRVNDPDDLQEAQTLSDEQTKGFGLLGVKTGIQTKSVTRTSKKKNTVKYGTNGWIYCTSIEPETEDEEGAWRAAMPSEYDAVTRICKPRKFARALTGIVAEQIGPQGPTVENNSRFGEHAMKTTHRQQTVFHGPVLYVEDPYARIKRARSNGELLLLFLFLKHAAHSAEREYRFAVWAEQEPTEAFADLQPSADLLDATTGRRRTALYISGSQKGLAGRTLDAPNEEAGLEPEAQESLALKAVQDPKVAVGLYPYTVQDLPGEAAEVVSTYAAAVALRQAVVRAGRRRRRAVASAAWHAEPIVRFLCEAFEDGISTFRVTEEDFVVITAEFEKSQARIEIAVGPEGSCTCRIRDSKVDSRSRTDDALSFVRTLERRLTDFNIDRR